MTGAMLVGSGPFVAEARVWLRRFGGNVYTSLPYAVSCLHGTLVEVRCAVLPQNTKEERLQGALLLFFLRLLSFLFCISSVWSGCHRV